MRAGRGAECDAAPDGADDHSSGISARVVRALSSPPATTHPHLLLTPTFSLSRPLVLAVMDVLGQYNNDDYSDLSGDERMDLDNDNSVSHDEGDYLDLDQPVPASSSRPSARKVCGCRKQEHIQPFLTSHLFRLSPMRTLFVLIVAHCSTAF